MSKTKITFYYNYNIICMNYNLYLIKYNNFVMRLPLSLYYENKNKRGYSDYL